MEYAALRRALSDRESALAKNRSALRREEALESLEKLRRGDVIHIASGRFSGHGVVFDPALRNDLRAPLGLTVDNQDKRVNPSDFNIPVQASQRMRIPK